MSTEIFYATGRRKTSSARVYLKKGKGDISVNDRKLDEYFGRRVERKKPGLVKARKSKQFSKR